MKEFNQIGRKVIPHHAKVKIATAIRDFTDVARVNEDTNKIEYSVEAFNNKDILRDPDSLGITVFFPNKQSPTHMLSKIYPISIGEREFGRQVKLLYKELRKKIPKEQWEK